jgi:hypothetical protein
MSKHGVVTREQKVAKIIIDLLSDIRLDLDIIGLYLGKYARNVIYNRFENIYEAAKEAREANTREDHMEYIRNINM